MEALELHGGRNKQVSVCLWATATLVAVVYFFLWEIDSFIANFCYLQCFA